MAKFVYCVHTEEKREGLFRNSASDGGTFAFEPDGNILLEAVGADPILYDIEDSERNGGIVDDWSFFFKLAYRRA